MGLREEDHRGKVIISKVHTINVPYTIVVNFEVVLSGFSTVVTLSFALFLLSFESSLEKSTLEE